ncbi:unnamed protein product [Porites evermanni]|uniref:Uncharacterized protein n=1 Tax=Porites evermanni TaxID=104178 RepID=A0ABN8M2D9_9CNID|nr:unnamed protein product [Porites evermanni]
MNKYFLLSILACLIFLASSAPAPADGELVRERRSPCGASCGIYKAVSFGGRSSKKPWGFRRAGSKFHYNRFRHAKRQEDQSLYDNYMYKDLDLLKEE